ncbi:MAG: class I SAM-dependent methyltransferase [Eubacterium sp.]|nr:class I SAM-dependent methyltransferase [Eubacterium sp.]
MKQNIYDNEEFFISFKALRESDNCYNELLEQPAMMKLLPNLNNKSVLDLGCGLGINCIDFVKSGASRVTGVDISKRMIDVAKSKNANDKISYINMALEDISSFDSKYDFVYSSLCFNYIYDFDKLIKDIFNLLNDNGILLFSQEHPIVTASIGNNIGYLKDKNDKEYAYCISNYQNEKVRRVEKWFVDGVIKYHRTFSTIINTLADSGFVIEKVIEPVPDEYARNKRSGLAKEFIKPTFLIVKAVKSGKQI